MKYEDIAKVCHEANRMYCHTLGDDSQNDWYEAPDWQQKSAINGVKFHVEKNLISNGIDSHDNWMKEKIAEGWVYGEVKDAEKKTHPCLRPYHELPMEQRKKDSLFVAIVRALASEAP